nr:hypothetical protein Iba_chr01dCG6080 [Ipomoea batatas]GMD09269.1 hypothetical protein Iba_scaffold39943CG0010 [Ipomoea batatas]
MKSWQMKLGKRLNEWIQHWTWKQMKAMITFICQIMGYLVLILKRLKIRKLSHTKDLLDKSSISTLQWFFEAEL